MIRTLALVAATLTAMVPQSGGAATPDADSVTIAPHRAVYDLELERAAPASGVAAAEGRMLFEWTDACDGWVVEQRYSLRLIYQEADPVELGVSFVTWESKDGERYRFTVRKLRDGEVEEDLRGRGDRRAIQFDKPEKTTVPLTPGTLFPSRHTVALIQAARRGDAVLAAPVFDGGAVEGAVDVAAAIGAKRPVDPAAEPLLRALAWPMRLAFFPPADKRKPEGQDDADEAGMTPDYELGVLLQENGVARAMTLDYGDFSVRAKLKTIEPVAKPPC